jgi:glycosyltransferase involved in cell wall biosynthesis
MPGRLLIVAAEFPPMRGIGRLRPLKFCQHLGGLGWETAVLAPEEGDLEPVDRLTLGEIPRATRVYRAPLPTPTPMLIALARAVLPPPGPAARFCSAGAAGVRDARGDSTPSAWRSSLGEMLGAFDRFSRRYLLIPDDIVLWTLPAIRQGMRAIAEFRPDVILATAPHFTNFIVGSELARRACVPWIADYRDLWTGDVLRDWVPRWRRTLEIGMERRIVGTASAVVTVSEPKTELVRSRLAGRCCSRFVTLTNGYDLDEFEGVEPEHGAPDALRIVYAGRLFKNRRGYEVLEACERVLEQHPEWRGRLRVEYYGGVAPEIAARMREIIDRRSLGDVIAFHPDVTYARSKALQKGADALLLIVDVGETTSGVIPGKLFEYMAAGRPILCIAEPGATTEIIERGNLGSVHRPGDVASLAVAIEGLFRLGGPTYAPRHEYVERFERGRLVQRLARLLEEVIADTSSKGRPA